LNNEIIDQWYDDESDIYYALILCDDEIRLLYGKKI